MSESKETETGAVKGRSENRHVGLDLPAHEIYHIHNKDNEMHAIDVILEVMERHLDRSKDGPCNSEDNVRLGKESMIRVAQYVLQRVS